MLIKPVLHIVLIVHLPNAMIDKPLNISKHHYSTQVELHQQPKQKETLKYNYITTEELIELNSQKYQDIQW